MPYNFTTIEKKWQKYWMDNKTFAAIEPAEAGMMPKAYILDMFPYPSGSGLHVGHPVGYLATDILSRFRRMLGYNVLHPMGWDAFGLPAEQYAVENNTHPRDTTLKNIANFRRQLQALGLSYDWDREVDTTDPKYYRWTQWIFLQLFNSYFDPLQMKAMPITHLMQELVNENYVVAPDNSIHVNPTTEGLEEIAGEVRVERLWRELSPVEQRAVIEDQRLAYRDEVPVNWCPALGTVLSNEEVIDGRSERGNHPVERRPMLQWMLRITSYADRLLADLDLLAWPDSLKEMQRNWIGKSVGAEVDFDIVPGEGQKPALHATEPSEDVLGDEDLTITVFTTRPDTLFGATYMVLAPEHPLVDRITSTAQKQAVADYRAQVARKSDRDRIAETKDKTGVFTGAHAINPVNDEQIPVYLADYVLMTYGTGAIMAVPAHDERDFEFARKFNLPIRTVVKPAKGEAAEGRAMTEDGIAVNSQILDGLSTAQAKEKIIDWLEDQGVGHRAMKYKLRDWLFSRQRYWGEPFPILLDRQGNPYPLREDELPVELPPMEDFKPTGTPEPPLSKAKEWVRYEISGTKPNRVPAAVDDVIETAFGRVEVTDLFRETNTMPQWAGSCWYYLRYIDPHNAERLVDPEKQRYWMPVDLYVGGAEHAVLHLLYARFWHKVLFDLGYVSTQEPFARLVNQGLILGEMEYHAFARADGSLVSSADVSDITEESSPTGPQLVAIERKGKAKVTGRKLTEADVEKSGDSFRLKSNPQIRVDARSFKMSKSRGNVVNPDKIIEEYGADTLRLYEMYMGPVEVAKPWNARDIVGMSRFLNSVWRNLVGESDGVEIAGAPKVSDGAIPEALERQLHRTVKKVAEDIESLRYNTAIAELIKLNNEMTGLEKVPRGLAENFVLMLAPFAPHIAEELWSRLGHHKSLARRPWPSYDVGKLAESTIELPVQVNGKLRDKISVPANASEADIFKSAVAAERVQPWLAGKTIRKQLYVTGKLVNFVVSE